MPPATAVCAILLSALLLATEHLTRRRTAVEHDTLRRLVEETERRRQAEAMAQQGQKMEALGRLTGGVAHDFKICWLSSWPRWNWRCGARSTRVPFGCFTWNRSGTTRRES